MNNNDNEQKSIWVYECSQKEVKGKEIFFEFTNENLKINTVINLIFEYFNVKTKKLFLFDWRGIEMTEDADLWKLVDDCSFNRVVFFQKTENFDNKNILQLFTLGDSLGEGGFGKVFKATFHNQPFAIKFITKCGGDVDYLFKEISVLAHLEHENVIKLYSYCGTDEDQIALIMEYASGGTLKKYIRNEEKLDDKEARDILRQILTTVKYCHSQDIIHRDLKPENILFFDEEHKKIKIIDFGISALLNTKTRAGSLNYISPEVLSGKDSSSLPSVDVWSIGCILYEMLTGKKMFDGTHDEVKSKIMDRKVVFPTFLSVEATDLIDRLCKYHTKDRLTIEGALDHPWMKDEKIKDKAEIEYIKRLFVKPKSTRHKHLTISNSGGLKNANKKIVSSLQNLNKKYVITKKPNEMSNEDAIFNYNLNVMNKYGGNMPGYMAPIGHSKTMKHYVNQVKDYFCAISHNSGSNSTRGNQYCSTLANEKKPTILPPLSSPKKRRGPMGNGHVSLSNSPMKKHKTPSKHKFYLVSQ